MGEFKAPVEQKNKTAAPVQEAKEASSLGEMEYVDSRASTFQLIQLQAAADDQGKGSRITQLQSKSTQFTGFSRVAQLQAKSYSKGSTTQPSVVQREENKTGLPDGLKSGMESISGMSLSDVKVHRNSDKPAQLQAHAYAQGTDIHLGPGQEKHLPHELGHVVQQKEGRVKPTMQLKAKVNINDDSGLEKEADVLGANAQKPRMISEVSHQTAVTQKMELEGEEPLQGKFIQGNVVQLQPFADLPPAEKRTDLDSTKSKVDSASKLTDIGVAIENSKIDAKKDDAVQRLKNTDTGVDRARTYFDAQVMTAEKQVFIEDRYPLALSDQKTFISKGLETILTETDDTKLQEADFNKLQSSANREGNSAIIFKPEVIDIKGMQETAKVASKGGGLSKVVGVGDFWDKCMDPALQQLWKIAGGGAIEVAKENWLAQTENDKDLAIKPYNLGPAPVADFDKFSSLAAAFPRPITGCWGITNDFKQFKNMEEAIKGLGLDKAWYPKGAFILTIPNTGLDKAVQNAEANKGALGKASVFSSLMWKEFNYMEQMRETNKTTSKTTKNDGVDHKDGNTEVMAINLQASDFFAQKPKYLGI